MNKKTINKILLTSIVLFSGALSVSALEFDTSVDAEIKEKYNSSKLEYEVLPNLPKVSPTSTPVPKVTPTYTTTVPKITQIDRTNAKKIPAGTKFSVKSNNAISDWSKEGATVSFTTTQPVFKNEITIPSGTKIYGKILESHQPQLTGNGGLVVLRLTSISLNGGTYEINGKITKANYKKIFFNNIKGKRQYWKGVNDKINASERFYNKTRKVSTKMANNPILIILSPIPTVVGFVGCSLGTIVSPVSAISAKGGHISLPAGSSFEIKLLDSAYVR